MVILRRPRVQESRQFQDAHATKKPFIEFRVITLKEPVADPEWMFHHPRFRRETGSPDSLPKIEPGFLKNTKRIFSRVPSARVNASRRILCERREGEQISPTCRHFCELLGPNLCKDCWKLTERSDAIREHSDCRPNELQRGIDPFSVMIASREKRTDYSESEEEILDEAEDEEFISKSSITRKSPSRDSGYSSRMSYIRSLSRTPSGDFCPRFRPPLRPSTRAGRRTVDDEFDKDISGNTCGITSNQESTPIWKNAYLTKLREKGAFKEVLNSLYYPPKLRHAWKDLPVQPVVMDLKLINFTIYDGSPLNQREISNSAET